MENSICARLCVQKKEGKLIFCDNEFHKLICARSYFKSSSEIITFSKVGSSFGIFSLEVVDGIILVLWTTTSKLSLLHFLFLATAED